MREQTSLLSAESTKIATPWTSRGELNPPSISISPIFRPPIIFGPDVPLRLNDLWNEANVPLMLALWPPTSTSARRFERMPVWWIVTVTGTELVSRSHLKLPCQTEPCRSSASRKNKNCSVWVSKPYLYCNSYRSCAHNHMLVWYRDICMCFCAE